MISQKIPFYDGTEELSPLIFKQNNKKKDYAKKWTHIWMQLWDVCEGNLFFYEQ